MSARIDSFSRVRAILDLQQKTGQITDALTGAAAIFPRGAAVRFEFLLMHGSELADASTIAAARLRVLSDHDPDSALGIEKTISSTSMNPGTTLAQWEAGDPSHAHLIFELTSSETAEGVFTGTITDESHKHFFQVTHGAGFSLLYAGLVNSFDAGYNPAAGTPAVTGSGATLEQIRALLEATLVNVVKFKGNPNGATIELSSPNGTYKVKLGTDDNGDVYTPTQTTT
jgi:hypothetical protein